MTSRKSTQAGVTCFLFMCCLSICYFVHWCFINIVLYHTKLKWNCWILFLLFFWWVDFVTRKIISSFWNNVYVKLATFMAHWLFWIIINYVFYFFFIYLVQGKVEFFFFFLLILSRNWMVFFFFSYFNTKLGRCKIQ